MTVLKFASAATGTGIIAPGFGKRFLHLRLLGSQLQHHLCRRAIAPQQLCHDAHRFVYMEEERFVARAQVIQPWLAIWRFNEAVLGALPMTGKAHLALAAVTRQALTFMHPELPLLV